MAVIVDYTYLVGYLKTSLKSFNNEFKSIYT